MFSWFRNETYEHIFLEDTSATESFEIYVEHYKRVSSELGYEYLPPEGQVSTLVWYLQHIKNSPEKAFLFAEMNAKNYPNSDHAQEQLEEIRAGRVV